MALHYYVIDTETTGLKSGHHEMTEIGIIRCTDRYQLHRKIRCEYPERANFDALKITGKTMADLAYGDVRKDVVKLSNEFFAQDGQQPAGRCIVAHNAAFDRKFLHALWESVEEEFPATLWLDTIALTGEFVKKSDINTLNVTKTATGRVSKNLHAACDLVGVKKLSEAHNAKVDSRNTYLLWKKLMDDGIDYLPHIKTFPHSIATQASVDDLLATLEDIGTE